MIEIGQSYEMEFSFTQSEVMEFIKITGDDNPIHHSEEYSKTTQFKKPIIHGFLSASIFSKILGTRFPGIGTIYIEQNLKFIKPMYVGQTYNGIVKVTSTNPDRHTCEVSTQILNTESEVTITGSAKIFNSDKI